MVKLLNRNFPLRVRPPVRLEPGPSLVIEYPRHVVYDIYEDCLGFSFVVSRESPDILLDVGSKLFTGGQDSEGKFGEIETPSDDLHGSYDNTASSMITSFGADPFTFVFVHFANENICFDASLL